MSKSILFTGAVIIVLAVLAGLTVRAAFQPTLTAAPRPTAARPFGPGWAADYGTYGEQNSIDRHDQNVLRSVNAKHSPTTLDRNVMGYIIEK